MAAAIYSTRSGILAVVLVGLLVVAAAATAAGGSAHGGGCTVRNDSGNDIVLIPVAVGGGAAADASVHIAVKAGGSAHVPAEKRRCRVRNAGNGHTSAPVTLAGPAVVVVDGSIRGTVKLLACGLVNGAIAVVANAVVLVQI